MEGERGTVFGYGGDGVMVKLRDGVASEYAGLSGEISLQGLKPIPLYLLCRG